MRIIPDNVETILKSRCMIGNNKPSCQVLVGDAPPTFLTDPTQWTSILYTGKKYGNMAETSDGRAIISYVDGYTVKVAFADTVAGVLAGTKTFGTGVSIKTFSNGLNKTSISLIDGKLHLAMWHGVMNSAVDPITAEMWVDTDGTGTSFSKLSDITTNLGCDSNGVTQDYTITTMLKLGNGNYAIVMPEWDSSNAYLCAFYSTNQGQTWTKGGHCRIGYISQASSKTLFDIGNNSFIVGMMDSSESESIATFSNSGASTSLQTISTYDPYGQAFITISETTYMVVINQDNSFKLEVHQLNDGVSVTAANLAPLTNFTKIYDYYTFAAAACVGLQEFSGQLALLIAPTTSFNGHADEEICYLSTPITQFSLPVTSVSINRNKNMASSASITLTNTGGEWSPDGITNPLVLFPNEKIVIKQGYGADMITTFTGLIDQVSLATFPQMITLDVRDNMKYLLDQTISSGSVHVLTYTNKTPEYIFNDLCTKAGLTVIQADVSGLTIASKTFSWETYADAIGWLADFCGGWEYGCDELGYAYFRKDTVPAASEWTLTFTSGAAQTAYYPIVIGSETITNTAKTTTYVKDTDYTIDYDTGVITSITIPDGATLMSYIFSAYTFREGEDIVSLGYTISDNNLFYKAAVYGQSGNTVLFADTDYPSAAYYNVLPQKFLKVDASEATTEAQCQAISDAAIALMESRARICQFEAIAVPWLQIGDLIQVIETSTTISELYRITDLSFKQDTGGYQMSITAFHHSYGGV